MEDAIWEKMTETRYEDSLLFCKISHFVLSEWPFVKDFMKFAKYQSLQMHAKPRKSVTMAGHLTQPPSGPEQKIVL